MKTSQFMQNAALSCEIHPKALSGDVLLKLQIAGLGAQMAFTGLTGRSSEQKKRLVSYNHPY